MSKLIVLLGPTASGKSSLAIKLAKKFNGEIVSADSRQIYRGMDIGTAKIRFQISDFRCQMSDVKCQMLDIGRRKSDVRCQRSDVGCRLSDVRGRMSEVGCQNISHHMVDIIDPDQEFSVAEYKKRAIKIIKDIQRGNPAASVAGKIPFLVGGTGLYIKAIVDNLKIPKVAPNKVLRDKLNKKSSQELIKELKKFDPEAAISIDPANRRRLIRALEVCLTTKKSFSKQQRKGKPLFDILQIGINLPRKKLYKKIDQRVDQMIKAGLVDEVKSLARKYSWDLPSMSGIGYRQLGQYLRQEIDLSQAIELIKRDTRRYARRQITWFKRDKRIKWVKGEEEAKRLIQKFLLAN